MERLFLDISLIVVTATVLGLIARLLKQPVILAYVLAGVLLGPAALNLIDETRTVHTLSSFGIAFLLFLVGLELDLRKLKSLGKVSLLLGLGQVLFTSGIGYVLVRLFGFGAVPAAYIAIALTFSSTIIIVKLLTEQRALESLYGRIAIGMLLVQDLIAMFALISLTGFTASAGAPSWSEFILIGLRGAMLFSFAILASVFMLPKVFDWLAKSTELLLLASIAWCFIFSLVTASVGFSLEIGALLAGLSLAPLPYNLEIVGRIRSLRDFFITIFFVVLGGQLTLASLSGLKTELVVLSLFVLIGNPLIVMVIMRAMHYRKRTGFLVGLTMAQVSEFSLIIMALGLKLGHVSPAAVSLVTFIGIVTITGSSYLVTHGERLYRYLAPLLSIFDTPASSVEESGGDPQLADHAVVFGYHRLGERFVRALKRLGLKLLVIDFDPEIIAKLRRLNIPCLYGDASDLDMHERANLKNARLVISTIPDVSDNLMLLKDLKRQGTPVPVYVTATTWEDTRTLYDAGADYVIFPHYLSGEYFSDLLAKLGQNPDAVRLDRMRTLAELELRYGSSMRT